MTYNEFRDLCHSTSTACGWWPETDTRRLKIPTTIALIHTEITEAWTFFEHGGADDHLPHHDGLAVELGDIVIRTADNAGAEKVDLDGAVLLAIPEFMQSERSGVYWLSPRNNHRIYLGGRDGFLALHTFAADATEAFRRGKVDDYALSLGRLMVACEVIALLHSYGLYEVAREKVAYNKVREDHKAEVRANEGGKII